MERSLSSVTLAGVYGTFFLTFNGAISITVADDASLSAARPSLGLGFIRLAQGIAPLAGIPSVGEISVDSLDSAQSFGPAIVSPLFDTKLLSGYGTYAAGPMVGWLLLPNSARSSSSG